MLSKQQKARNQQRAMWGEKTIQHFSKLCKGENDPETALCDLLADLMHWAKEQDIDFELAVHRAREHFAAEVRGED